MAHLFDPLPIRGITMPNRIGVSPMCQYSSNDGFANDWHLVHLGSRATGGAGLVFCEATAVTAEGRITPEDLGIWKDAHIEFLARIVRFLKTQGTVPGHADCPCRAQRQARKSLGSAITRLNLRMAAGCLWRRARSLSRKPIAMPRALLTDEIRAIVDAFARPRAALLEAGFQVLEIHAAHGYLAHEFFSPLSNFRTDEYGGSFENRTRIGREIVSAVRKVWPENLPLFHSNLGNGLERRRLGPGPSRGTGQAAQAIGS